MSIATRIQSMYENVGEVYDTITNVTLPEHKNIENIPSTIRESYLEIMNNGIDVVWDNWEKVNGSGTSITLNNTEYAPMKLEYGGNTSQDSTTGKNLIHLDSGTFTSGGVTWTITDSTISATDTATGNWSSLNNFVSFSTPLEAGTYTFSIPQSLPKIFQIVLRDDNNTNHDINVSAGNTSQTITTTYTAVYWKVAYRAESESVSISMPNKLQFEKGNKATTYEPYTGGIPAPNPDFPMPVHVVSGDNTVEVSNGDNTSTTYPINLPEGMFLGSIGDYKDTFFKTVEGNPIYDSLDSATKQTLDSNEWYLEKKIGKVVLDGSESWTTYQGTIYNLSIIGDKGQGAGVLFNARYINGYCNLTDTSSNVGQTTIKYAENNCLGLQFYNATTYWGLSEASESALNTYLSNNNLILYYPLATPTYTKIEGTLKEQLEEIKKSKNGQTNISQTNNDLPFVLDVSALKEI